MSCERVLFHCHAAILVLALCICSAVHCEETIRGWEPKRNRSIPLYVLPNENTTLLQPTNLCVDNTPILLLIVVFSATNHFSQRQQIRETWGNSSKFNYPNFFPMHSKLKGKYLPINDPDWKRFTVGNVPGNDPKAAKFRIRTVFLLGQSDCKEVQKLLVKENKVHKDLIQERFMDTYKNLTLKSDMMLKWMVNNCNNQVKYIMKCDGDTFINVPNLVHVLLGGTVPVYKAVIDRYDERTFDALSPENRLSRLAGPNGLLVGHRFCHPESRKEKNKWFVPHYMYDNNTYPNYLSGVAYVFDVNAARKLYNAAMDTPLFHLEDVYLTGICAQKAQIEPINNPLFSHLHWKTWCAQRGMIVANHNVKATDIPGMLKFVMNPKRNCIERIKPNQIKPFEECK